eukprot:scaffold36143_cov31-Tisochrysis_lutea.AAC.8
MAPVRTGRDGSASASTELGVGERTSPSSSIRGWPGWPRLSSTERSEGAKGYCAESYLLGKEGGLGDEYTPPCANSGHGQLWGKTGQPKVTTVYYVPCGMWCRLYSATSLSNQIRRRFQVVRSQTGRIRQTVRLRGGCGRTRDCGGRTRDCGGHGCARDGGGRGRERARGGRVFSVRIEGWHEGCPESMQEADTSASGTGRPRVPGGLHQLSIRKWGLTSSYHTSSDVPAELLPAVRTHTFAERAVAETGAAPETIPAYTTQYSTTGADLTHSQPGVLSAPAVLLAESTARAEAAASPVTGCVGIGIACPTKRSATSDASWP